MCDSVGNWHDGLWYVDSRDSANEISDGLDLTEIWMRDCSCYILANNLSKLSTYPEKLRDTEVKTND